MTLIFALVIVAHGLIHVLGAAKAFGWADLPQLTQPIPPSIGCLWLLAALLFLATAAALFLWPRWWWTIGASAVLLSIAAIMPSWIDAKFGVIGNAVALTGVVFGFLAHGPTSLRAEYDNDVASLLPASTADVTRLTDEHLAHLPIPVRRYLHMAGVVGQPLVRHLRVRMHGQIRSGPEARWMPFVAEQHTLLAPAARLFYMNASMFAIPIQGYHRYVGPAASMRVKAAGLVPVASAAGHAMTQSETVTLFNDICVMAPAALIDPAIVWDAIDAHTARARFTNAGHTIEATLTFNEAGEMTNFVSDDRYQAAAEGASDRPVRWSTPLAAYRQFGAVRLASRGEGRWHESPGEYAYIDLTIDRVEYNPPTQ